MVKVIKKKVRGKVLVNVVWRVVRVGGGGATGKVTVTVGKKTYTRTLKGGRVTTALGKHAPRGRLRVTAAYAGDAKTNSASKALTIRLG